MLPTAMPNDIESAFLAALEPARREALLSHVGANPDVTLGELVALGNGLGEVAASLTVRELLTGGSGLRNRAPARKSKPEAKRPRRRGNKLARPRSKTVDTRTAEGRAAYDEAVLAAVRDAGGDVQAEALLAAVGGTASQLRASLHRAIASKQIVRKGKARATTYRAR